MVPSPRKRAAPASTIATTFTTTWDDTDAAFFDPNTLPLAKIPRGWERKQEVKRIGQGKEKKIWRRFNLRSRTDNTAQEEADDEQEQDARSRAVKRRQHMSPRAMEKTAGRLNGKKRAFKATRWDRRKSVLPSRPLLACRKRAAPTAECTPDVDSEADREEDSFETIEGDSGTFTHETPDDPIPVDYPELPLGSDGNSQEEPVVADSMESEMLHEAPTDEAPETANDIAYPSLPPVDATDVTPTTTTEEDQTTPLDNDEEMQPIQIDTQQSDEAQGDPNEEFTEASLQLDILRDYQKALQQSSPASRKASDSPSKPVQHDDQDEPDQDEAATEDITDGLVLSLTPSKPASPTPRKLHSPPPPPRLESGPDDVTMTVAFDDDTAMLKDFLNRAAASKAEKAAITTHRRESLQNRRDSDVVRHALASPRKALEEKDPNSPTKLNPELTLDLSQALTLSPPIETLSSPTVCATETESADDKNAQGTRRSSRAKKSRLPAPAPTGPAPAPKIAIRRNDGNEVVVLKKDDAKVLADLTRANTRKNKQGAYGVTVRLMKAQMEAMTLPPIDDTTKELIIGKNVRWDEQLAYYQENPDTLANALAEAESLATPDELGFSDSAAPEPKKKTKKKKEKTSKTSTPKVRRVKGLGTANGTPAKGLAAPEALEEDNEEEAAAAEKNKTATQSLPRPKGSKGLKIPVASSSSSSSSSSSLSIDANLSSSTSSTATTKLPSLDIAPVGISQSSSSSSSSSSSQTRKSRLTAPKKVVLPTPSQAKENIPRATTTATATTTTTTTTTGLSDATPKKGIPAPKVAPTLGVGMGVGAGAGVGMESGLPRRRGKKY
ncbi:hypothetical protein DDE83_007392 [Stemphylium lycopersici]|uniref:Uncharacterized protein n=1 Tax=Stemphylium lycopersici TaxID=183478 RepID=A0A364MW65_STELY|nr:hypothetical protein DDE83_007392 [Stemphylium lycopersici]